MVGCSERNPPTQRSTSASYKALSGRLSARSTAIGTLANTPYRSRAAKSRSTTRKTPNHRAKRKRPIVQRRVDVEHGLLADEHVPAERGRAGLDSPRLCPVAQEPRLFADHR